MGTLSKSQDVWASGIFLALLLTGQMPLSLNSTSSSNHIIQQIEDGKFNYEHPMWKDVSEKALQFVRKLLDVEPSKKIESV